MEADQFALYGIAREQQEKASTCELTTEGAVDKVLCITHSSFAVSLYSRRSPDRLPFDLPRRKSIFTVHIPKRLSSTLLRMGSKDLKEPRNRPPTV